MGKNIKKYMVILLLIFSIFGLAYSTASSFNPNKNEILLNPLISSPSVRNNLIFGTMSGPNDADPQYLWDGYSFDYAYQVWEGLYAYNFSDPDSPLIPRLATDFGTWSGNNYTVTLRQNVTFHSGAKFNSTAVKFTFDRLLYLCNFTGDQGAGATSQGVPELSILYMWPDGTSILNRTEIVDEFTVKFVLNSPYGAWLPLLTFTASMILDPTITPDDDYISVGMATASEATVSGTGPWIFENYTTGVVANFRRNDDYWRGPGEIERLVFSVIQDANARNTALLNGDVDILDAPHPSYYDTMAADPDINLYEVGSSTTTQYLGFNNKILNKTWRNAMSYAINYTYMIDELLEGEAERLKSPIPLGIQFANWSYDVPTYNLTKSRQYMQSMGFGVGFTTDGEWQAATFRTVNYTYNLGNTFREDMLVLLQYCFDYIGIDVVDNGLNWTQYIDLAYNITAPGYDGLELWFIVWMPDYNDPSNYVNNLMSNISSMNQAQINDPILEAYMLAGLEETDQDVRRQIYWDMQKYIVESLRPWAFGYVAKNYDAWDAELKGYPSNFMGYNYFYPCYWEEDYSIQITQPPDVNYVEGSTGNSISWIMTAITTSNPNYTIYRDLTELENNTWTSGSPIVINVDGLSAGSYNYSIQAYNGPFPQLSNVDYVIVNITPEVFDYSIQITHPPDVSYVEGSTGNSISWIITAIDTSNPTYTIHRDLTLLENDAWVSGTPLVINVDGLSAGVYNYSIQAFNGLSPQSTNLDYVIVNVTSEVSEGALDIPGFPVGMFIAVSSISVFYVRKRSKNKISKIKS